MPLKEDRPHAQHVDGLREQIVRRRAVAASAERLQLLDGRRAQVDGRCVSGVDAEVQARQAVRRILGARERPDDVEQFFLGQPDQWAAQQRAERERVAAVGEDAGERDEVLDLLAAEEPFAGLGRDRDAAPLQRFFIAPQIASRRREKGDVARPGKAALAGLAVDEWPRCRSAARTCRRQPRLRRRAGARREALPSSSATAMSRAATHRPSLAIGMERHPAR